MASINVPSTMKGVIIEKTGGVDVLQHKTNLPVPEPQENQVLVKNEIIGVNFIDTYFRSGLYPAPQFPYTLGRESTGTIVKLGPGTTHYNLRVGDKVVVLSDKTYAEYTAAAALMVVKIPDATDAKLSTASLMQGLTALTLTREAHHVEKDDWVLVHAAAGGTGLWLCKVLQAVGAKIIGTASSEEKMAQATRAGATHMINYSKDDVKSKVLELTDGKGCIAVFDGVGKSTFDLSLDLVARKGSMISFGNASGAPPPLSIARLSAKNVRLMRPTLYQYIVTREEIEAWVGQLFDFITKHNVDPRIHEIYPLSDVGRAHNDLQDRKTSGKLLLDPSK